MDALGKAQVDLTERRLDPLTRMLAEVRDPSGNLAGAVLLARGNQVKVGVFAQEVLYDVVGIRGIGMHFGLGRQVQRQAAKRRDVGLTTRRKHDLDRLAVAGNQQMHLEAVEVAPLTGTIAAKRRVLVELAAPDADVVAAGNRATVHDILARGVVVLGNFG